MTFASVKGNQASKKFYLIRMTPARYMNAILVDAGGGLFTNTFTEPITRVEENGVLLTEVSSSPANGQWSHDESTGVFTVDPLATPSNTNAVVVFYYLFYTGERSRVVTEDPEDSTTTKRDWLPRIKTSPVITNTVENITKGFLEIGSSVLTLVNDNNEFEEFLTDDDSFHNKEIKIWLSIDEVENIQKIFEGKITEIGLAGETVNIQFNDPLAALNSPALMGDDPSDAYFTIDSFANLDPNSNNLPIPYFVGSVSRYKNIQDTAHAGLPQATKTDSSTLYTAACTNFSTTISVTTNREWGIGRVSTDGFSDFSFTPSSINQAAAGYTRLDGTEAQARKFHTGDTFIVNDAGVDRYQRCISVNRASGFVFITKEALLTTGDDVEANDCPTVIVTEGDTDYILLYSRDYTTTVTTTSGGNKYLKITLADDFETNFGITILDPGIHEVKFRVKPDTTKALHGFVAQSLLEGAGLTVNAASVAAANTALAVNANFSIPNFDEGDFGSYLQYLQDLLKSTLGYASLNNSFEIEYSLFDAASSTTELTDTDISIDSFNVEINYRDVVNELIVFNPHYNSSEAIEDGTDSPSFTQNSAKATHLHEINKPETFRHVLESMNARVNAILNLGAERTAVYVFDTKIVNIDSIIGDDFLLSKTGLLGGDATRQVTIVSLSKSPNKTKVIMNDLLGL